VKPTPLEPASGQESVWDYPRPPRVEDVSKHIEVVFNGVKIADTCEAKRILETSHPPVYYISRKDIRMEYLVAIPGTSLCEWKGRAHYYTVAVGNKRAERAAWYYPDPKPVYAVIKDRIAFYPARVDACYVDGERVRPQSGGFYGGWITRDIVGPFKGDPGTLGW